MKVHRRHARRRSVLAATLVLGGVLGGVLPGGPAAAEQTAPGPMLSIAIDNGRTSAAAGDTLDYTITLTNLGTTAVKGLRVTQTMPEGLSLETADRRGRASGGLVVWTVDLAPGRDQVLHTSMTLGETPDEMLRMASVACAAAAGSKAPLVCAAHSDELPAGSKAREQADEAEAAAPASGSDDATSLQAGLVGGGALLVVVAGLALLVRRRSRAATARHEAPPVD